MARCTPEAASKENSDSGGRLDLYYKKHNREYLSLQSHCEIEEHRSVLLRIIGEYAICMKCQWSLSFLSLESMLLAKVQSQFLAAHESLSEDSPVFQLPHSPDIPQYA
jgi:hypothetical protein